MIRVVLLLFVINLISFSVSAENISTNHPSPYVRMHANDAVKWQVWDRSILERAKKENKLIFISTGYYACHWCHVMRKESFNDDSVAKILNDYFIPVKIDRELNPVLDKYLMSFLVQTQGYGGWPLNVFVTPDGYPLTGLVYLPKNEFKDVVKNINTKWKNEEAVLKAIALNVFNHTKELSSKTSYISADELLGYLHRAVEDFADDLQGGFGNESKFPMPYLMMSLLKVYEENRSDELGEFIELTLNQMVEQGLHDSIAGGFFRYTIDQGWQVPHFEKMLYTNAAMIKLYVSAYKIFKNKKWLLVAEETMAFVIKEMKTETGFYVSSLSAQDVNAEEGGNYLWQINSLKSMLDKKQKKWIDENVKFSELDATDKVLPLGFWQGEQVSAIKKVLLSKRDKNPILKDNKMIVSWNAYLLSAMLDLKQVSSKKVYNEAAVQLLSKLKGQIDFGLVRNRRLNPQKYLQDYVFVSYVLWQWDSVHSVSSHSHILGGLISEMLVLFYTENGWSETDHSLISLPNQVENFKDGDLPSAEVVLLELIEGSSLVGNLIKKKIKRHSKYEGIDQRVLDGPLEYSSLILYRSSVR